MKVSSVVKNGALRTGLNHTTKIEAVHGGHVKEVDRKASKKYIVPLCAACNENKDDKFQYPVLESVMLPVVEIS